MNRPAVFVVNPDRTITVIDDERVKTYEFDRLMFEMFAKRIAVYSRMPEAMSLKGMGIKRNSLDRIAATVVEPVKKSADSVKLVRPGIELLK